MMKENVEEKVKEKEAWINCSIWSNETVVFFSTKLSIVVPLNQCCH
jgi:hypothetical protein